MDVFEALLIAIVAGLGVPRKQAPSNVSWHLGQAAETFESPARGYWQLRSTKELREN